MKINFRLWMVIFFLCLYPRHLKASQELPFFNPEVTISMDLQDASLKDVLKIFSIQSGLNFIASEAVQDRKITLYLTKVPVKEVMDKLFKANNLSYELDTEANIFIVKEWGKPQVETITKVFYLKYRSVSSANIETEKNNLFTKSVSSGASSAGTDIIDSVKQVLGPQGKVNEDKRTNSLIVTDVPARFSVIEEVISRLDIPQPQVMLEIEMLDVNKDTTDKLGFKFTDNPFTLILPGPFVHKGADFFIGDMAKRGKDISSLGVAGSVILGRTYAQLLDFLRTQKDTKYLARPRLLTLNNETAEISITKDEVVTKKKVWISNASESGGGHWEETFERATSLSLTPEGIGIFLKVTPLINPETQEITMVVNPKSSSASQSSQVTDQVALDPEVRSTKSIVKVKDGETIILGGLIHQEKDITLTKIPILGDLPVLGALFRHRNISKDIEREFLVFITPHIIKDTVGFAQGQKKAVFPEREQNTVSGIERQAAITINLNKFEKKKN